MTKPCNKCGRPIDFSKVDGKWHAVNPDGSPHWTMCGKPVRPSVWKESKPQLKVHSVTIGQDYVKTECDCPPWEGCYKCCPEITQDQSKFLREIWS